MADASARDLDTLRRESLIAVSADIPGGGFFWRVTPAGFDEYERRAGEEWAATLPPARPIVVSPTPARVEVVIPPLTVTIGQWFDHVPLDQPSRDLLDADRRTVVLEKLQEAIRQLNGEAESAPEWSAFESAVFANVAIPGLQLAIAAIEIGDALATQWHRARGMFIAAVERLEAARAAIVAAADRHLTSPSSQLLAGGVLGLAIDLIRGLLF